MEFTARMIAEIIGGTVEGNENVTVNTFAKIEEGTDKSLSFLANPKYTKYIYETSSPIVLVSDGFEPEHPVKATLIRVENPYAALSLLMAKFSAILNPQPVGVENPSFISMGVEVPDDAYIGAFAYIGENVTLSKNVKIYPQSYIGNNVVIGENTIIYPGVKIYAGVIIGKNCIIHSGVVLGADGFGFAPLADGTYSKIPQLGNIVIGDNVEIGANTTVDRATMGSTVIGDGTKLDNLIQIAHNVKIGHDTVIASQTGIAGSAQIGDNCMFAGQVGVAGHIKIGDRVTVGAQSGIPNSVPDDSRLMGYPAVPGMAFARQTSLIKRLPELFERLANIEKLMNSKNK